MGIGLALVIGAVAPFAQPVAPARAGADETFVRDSFDRTLSGEWRRADLGGLYAHAGDGSTFAVGNGVGKITVKTPGGYGASTLGSTAGRDVNATITVATNRKGTGKGQHVSLFLRNSSPGTGYLAQVRFASDGRVLTSIRRSVAGVTTLLAPEVTVSGLVHRADRKFRIRASATGVNPPAIRVKVWPALKSQPKAWSSAVSDASDLKAIGSVGLRVALPATTVNHPISFSFDNFAANTTQVAQVAMAVAAPTVYARDSFERSGSSTWGTSDQGGAYSLTGSVGNYSVDGQANVALGAGNTRAGYFASISVRDVDLAFRVKMNKTATGTGQFAYGLLRNSGAGTEYRAKLRFDALGHAYLQATRAIDTKETSLGSEIRVAGLARGAGQYVWLRAQATGSTPTTIRMRAWLDGQAEPLNWPFLATDTTASLQVAGAVGLRG
ncbi:hypothetical protein BH24ACT15_BH24ACT15_35200 [soil metagenome]